ncbi:MAG: hypothetical protein P8P74_16090 [Crocinitomicaceae bacterium]|nr:hypothetical protein [Crocinitomicaceae bacterium]
MSVTSDLSELFSAGFQSFLLKKNESGESIAERNNNYRLLYHKYMGVALATPDELEGKEIQMPKWEDENRLMSNSVIKSIFEKGVLRIGTYPHAPYYYADEDYFDVKGFEYEMAQAVAEEIALHYKLDSLKVEWVEKNVETSGDGTENTDILGILKEGLVDNEYDMVFSGIFEGDRDVVYAARTNLFYIGALYTGRGDFGVPPTKDFQSICEWFAQKSSEEEPIRVTHTKNGNQSSAGALIENTIEQYGGYVNRRGLFVDEIMKRLIKK